MTKQRRGKHGFRNADELLEALSSVVERSKSIRIGPSDFGLLEALAYPDIEVSGNASIEIHKLSEGLTKLVQGDKRFPGAEVRMIRGEGGASGFYPGFVGVSLVRRVLRSGNPEEALRWLSKVLQTTAADGQSITALWGVPVEKRAQLTEMVDIAPIEDLPDSQQKKWVTDLLFKGSTGPIWSGLLFEN